MHLYDNLSRDWDDHLSNEDDLGDHDEAEHEDEDVDVEEEQPLEEGEVGSDAAAEMTLDRLERPAPQLQLKQGSKGVIQPPSTRVTAPPGARNVTFTL